MFAAELEVPPDAVAVVVAFRDDSLGLGVCKGQFFVRHPRPPVETAAECNDHNAERGHCHRHRRPLRHRLELVEAAGGGDLAAVVGDAAEQFLAQLLRRRRALADWVRTAQKESAEAVRLLERKEFGRGFEILQRLNAGLFRRDSKKKGIKGE